MYYLQLMAPSTEQEQARPRDVIQGPFASANEARAYWTKLNMWFPDAMREAKYRIMDDRSAADTLRSGGRLA